MFQYSGTHAGSSGGAGGHSHTLGSFAGSGALQQRDNAQPYSDWINASGVFSTSGFTDWRTRCTSGGTSGANTLHFTLNSNTVGGASSSVGNHSHTITNQNTGGGKAHNNMQPYLVVNIWKRTE